MGFSYSTEVYIAYAGVFVLDWEFFRILACKLSSFFQGVRQCKLALPSSFFALCRVVLYVFSIGSSTFFQ